MKKIEGCSRGICSNGKECKHFLENVEIQPGDHWFWSGSGWIYGHFCLRGRIIGAHRAAWIIFVGPIPDGLEVLHHCDIPYCVNPLHLFVGTQVDNIQDCIAKGRRFQPDVAGEKNGQAKITADQARRILELARGGWSNSILASNFGVSTALIKAIKARRIWKCVS